MKGPQTKITTESSGEIGPLPVGRKDRKPADKEESQNQFVTVIRKKRKANHGRKKKR